MVGVAEEVDYFQSTFDRVVGSDAAPGATWLRPIRSSAMARFCELGFPTTRHEEWRYTDVSLLSRTPFESSESDTGDVTGQELEPYRILDADGIVLVFVNGCYCESLSSTADLPSGVTICSLPHALNANPSVVEMQLTRHAKFEDDAFVALNTALMENGAYLHVQRDTVVDRPIHILHMARSKGHPRASHPRTLIVADENTQVTILESFVSQGDGVFFRNAVTELVAGDGAVVDYYKLECEREASIHIGALQLTLRRSSNVSAHTMCFGGGVTRNNVNVLLAGEGGDCSVKGLYVLEGRQQVDNHLVIDHAKPHCDSREFYKGVLGDHSKGIFSGRIIVREGAQKTDAKQTNMSLLLSNDAQVESKPQLEIYADDVKCTHGATIGQVNEEAIFYLQSRGISARAARQILIYAFARESADEIRLDRLREVVETLVANRIGPSSLVLGDL
jgi:Fe-S cluster assembly protein SufD